jgi:hypothetical protein
MTPQKAQADVVVERRRLAVPGEKRRIRAELYRALTALGRVETVERYIQDPPDGPHRDPAYHLGAVDFDRYAVIRIVGMVTPRPTS